MRYSNINFPKTIPKVELHRHLDCSWRYSTLVELAKDLKLISSTDVREVEDKMLVTQPMTDLNSVLKKFTNAQKLLHSEAVLTRLAYETLEDAYNDGVLIIELRYSLNFIQQASGLSYDKIHSALLAGIDKALKKYPIATGLISIFQRDQDKAQLQRILDFTVQNKSVFIGADLADNEAAAEPNNFKWLFDQLHHAGIPITIHAGETPDALSPQRVKDSIEILHAQRIGHGIQSIQNPDVINFVKSRNVHLEICPISNTLTQAFANRKSHPFRELYENGVSVSVNSDDPGIFNTYLSDDYHYLIREFNFTVEDFQKINKMAYQASFIDEALKKKVWSNL
ncbi:MAG: adenosine deaminase [Bdellovibrionaceae bacterium]|nr:adenosine deaminase [Pseudobdellovibrionaceae bacterium]